MAFGFIKKPYIYLFLIENHYIAKLLRTLYTAYVGVSFAWIGSIIGERIRPKIRMERLGLKKGFLTAYIFYTVLFFLLSWGSSRL
jgi:hypothetical protein